MIKYNRDVLTKVKFENEFKRQLPDVGNYELNIYNSYYGKYVYGCSGWIYNPETKIIINIYNGKVGDFGQFYNVYQISVDDDSNGYFTLYEETPAINLYEYVNHLIKMLKGKETIDDLIGKNCEKHPYPHCII